MDKQVVENAVKELKANSPKRNFKQSVDLIINLKDINLKNADEQVNIFVTLAHETGRKFSACALVGPEMQEKAKAAFDEVILVDDFERFKNKKDIKQLAERHSYFIAQANIMAKIATAFGRVFGPRGKMPNPKVGAVIPPNVNVEPLYEKLKKTLHIVTKNDPSVRCLVGKEDMADTILIDNILTVYNSVLQKLPNEQNNIKSVMIKTTMGHPIEMSHTQKAEAATEGKKKGKKVEIKAKKEQ